MPTQNVTMIAVYTRDGLIARLDRHLPAMDDRLLTDVEVAKTAINPMP